MPDKQILVEVVYALPDRQRLVSVLVPEGTTMLEAVHLSGIVEHFPGLDVHGSAMGVFGKIVVAPAERVLEAGERVEIYRPLLADPREVRKQRAAKAREALKDG